MTTVEIECATRRDDAKCQTDASAYLRSLIGAAPDDLVWDHLHHLQGHAHCAGQEIIVIAARDSMHRTLVLTPHDWDGIRRLAGPDRRKMMRSCAIESHSRLIEALSSV